MIFTILATLSLMYYLNKLDNHMREAEAERFRNRNRK